MFFGLVGPKTIYKILWLLEVILKPFKGILIKIGEFVG